jgi:hypothetical protein
LGFLPWCAWKAGQLIRRAGIRMQLELPLTMLVPNSEAAQASLGSNLVEKQVLPTTPIYRGLIIRSSEPSSFSDCPRLFSSVVGT